MKITSFETFIVPPRWMFLKIETDEGIVGWGEPTLEGWTSTMQAAVHEVSGYFIGKDPFRIEHHWQALFRNGCYRGGPVLMSVIAGIDQALWDIKGKHANLPVYQLLGGSTRDKVQAYTWIGGDRPSGVAEQARKALEEGFKAVKLNAVEELHYIDSYDKIDQAIERIASIREAVGNRLGIAIDFHGRVHKAMAKILVKELEQFRPMFYEDPVLSEHSEALREIANHTNIPLAIGERLYSRWDFKRILAEGYVDIIQPDLSHAGGITECKKIISMAEAYDVAAAPHCPLGPIALAACLQVDATANNVFIQEQSLGIHYNQGNDLLDYVKDFSVFECKKGYMMIPQGPGLGIEVNEEYVREKAKEGSSFRAPFWYLEDGTVAEW